MDENVTGLLLRPAALLWAVLHMITAFYNFVHGIDKGYGHSYGWAGYALTACYLLILLFVNLTTAYERRRSAAQVLGRYWLASLAICAGLIWVRDITDFLPAGMLAILMTPLLPLAPLLELVPVPTQVSGAVLSLLCWLLCRWGRRKG